MRRLNYYRRLLPAYLFRLNSHLTFWHDVPEINQHATAGQLGQYYMPFIQKASYTGPFDSHGIPLLDYRGAIGKQYNPIAISQYGLGNYNVFHRTNDPQAKHKFISAAQWLVENLAPNSQQVPMWHHHFDFEYRDTLRAPWYSGLAQGQGLSLLVRAYATTGENRFKDAAHAAFQGFRLSVADGGVVWHWDDGDIWFEEYIVHPPTHILNGFIWALWGVYDYGLATGDGEALDLFRQGVQSLKNRLPCYDWGHWSLYELSGTLLKMVASPFYHRLHIAQLLATERLTGEAALGDHAHKWEGYLQSGWHRRRALGYKLMFKLLYY